MKRSSLKPSKSPIHTTDLEPTPSLLSRHKDKLIMAGLGLTVLTLFSTLIFRSSALTNQFIPLSLTSSTNTTGSVQPVPDATAAGGSYLKFVAAGQDPSPNPPATSGDYDSNLAKILSSTFRNRNEDNSPYLYTPSVELVSNGNSPLFGPRSEYSHEFVNQGDPGQGKFRTECEFSHFAYDDPLMFPNQPEAAHLHMFFGNTHANAYSTYETLIDQGGGTCNGRELNRTAYWAPAIIDQDGNVRVPYQITVYYKSFGPGVGNTSVYPAGLGMVDDNYVNKREGGPDIVSFLCNHINNDPMLKSGQGEVIPNCQGGYNQWGEPTVLEHNVKFKNCWTGRQSDLINLMNNNTMISGDSPSWFSGNCPGSHPVYFPNLEYRIWYIIEPGENTSGWFLSSDIDPSSGNLFGQRGSTNHADWWGGWNMEVNQMWVDRCSNVEFADCQSGFLGGNYVTDTQYPALKYRTLFNGPIKVPGAQLFQEVCTVQKQISSPADLAYCRPG